MAAPLVTRNTGDIIPASDHNDILEYIETGTYRINAKNMVVTVADGDNVIPIVLTNNDTTNNQYTLEIDNNTTGGTGLFIDGGSATTGIQVQESGANYIKFIPGHSSALFYRNFSDASTGSNMINITQDNATSSKKVINLINNGTGIGINIDQQGDGIGFYINSSATTQNIISGYSNSARTTGSVARFMDDNNSSVADVVSIRNDGSGAALNIDQNGPGQCIYATQDGDSTSVFISHDSTSNGITLDGEVGSARDASRYLLDINDKNPSNTRPTVNIINEGTGVGINLIQNGDGIGLLVDQNGDANAVVVYGDSTAATMFVRHEAVNIGQAGFFQQNGQGVAFEIEQNGDNTGLYVDQNGDGIGIRIDDSGIEHGLYINSTAIKSGNRYVANFVTSNGSNTQPTVNIQNAGTGAGLRIDQDGDASSIIIDTEAGANAISMDVQAGNAIMALGNPTNSGATYYFGRNVTSGTSAGPVGKFNQANASDDQPALTLEQHGTGYGQYILAVAGANDAIRVLNQGTNNGIHVDQDGNGDAIYSENFGTGRGIFVNQDGDGIGLQIDSEATSIQKYGLYVITGQGATAGRFEYDTDNFVYLSRPSNGTGGGSNWFYRDHPSSTTDEPVVFIEQDNAGDDQDVLRIQQDGSGNGIDVNMTGDLASTSGIRIDVTGTQNSNGYGFYASDTGATGELAALLHLEKESGNQITSIGRYSAGSIASNYFYRNLASPLTNSPVMFVEQDNSGDDQNAFLVQQDGTGWTGYFQSVGGKGVYIDQNNNAAALQIDTEATDASPIYIAAANNGAYSGLQYVQDAGATGRGITLQMASTGAEGLRVLNEGTNNGILIDQNGAGIALNVDYDGGGSGSAVVIQTDAAHTGRAVYIDQSGSGLGLEVEVPAASTTDGLWFHSDSLSKQVRLLRPNTETTGTNMFYRNLASTATAGALVRIEQDHATDDQPALLLQQDGTAQALAIYQNGSAGAHIKLGNMSADPSGVAAGDIWYNTTDDILKYHNGAATVELVASGGSELGEVKMFALSMTGAVTKASLQGKGWAICDGTTPATQGISSPTITTTPNLEHKFIRMSDDDSSGSTGGADTHTLTEAEMPSHDHSYTHYGPSGDGEESGVGQSGLFGATTGATGGDGAHNNLPSYYEMAFFMKVK